MILQIPFEGAVSPDLPPLRSLTITGFHCDEIVGNVVLPERKIKTAFVNNSGLQNMTHFKTKKDKKIRARAPIKKFTNLKLSCPGMLTTASKKDVEEAMKR